MLEPGLTDMEEMLIDLLDQLPEDETQDDCTEFAIFSNSKMITVILEWHEV